jgi:hydrogenase expression/formation protein HypC
VWLLTEKSHSGKFYDIIPSSPEPKKEYKMCLGIPAKVISIEESKMGKVDYMGTKVRTDFTLLEDVKIGDWVIIHAGFAISQLDEKEAAETLELIKDNIASTEKPTDHE